MAGADESLCKNQGFTDALRVLVGLGVSGRLKEDFCPIACLNSAVVLSYIQNIVFLNFKVTFVIQYSWLGEGFGAFRPQKRIRCEQNTPMGALQTPGVEDRDQIMRMLMFYLHAEKACLE